MRTIIATILAVIVAAILISSDQSSRATVEFSSHPASAAKAPPKIGKPDHVKQPKNNKQRAHKSPCGDEVSKYNAWNKNVAQAVMRAESKDNPKEHNDNESTGDYSIGCFQINLKGADNLAAKYRDAKKVGYKGKMRRSELEVWLKHPANNVAVADIMYKNSGWVPWSATTCKYKVKCY